MSANLLQIQTRDQHLASSLNRRCSHYPMGISFNPQRSASLERKDRKIMRQETLACKSAQFSICSTETLLVKQNAKGCTSSTGRPPMLIARGFTSVKTEGWIHDATEERNETGFWHKLRRCLEDTNPCHLVPSTHSRHQLLLTQGTSPSSLQQPTSYVLDLYHPGKHFGGMILGF